jgi:hypothetical protein
MVASSSNDIMEAMLTDLRAKFDLKDLDVALLFSRHRDRAN